MKLELHMTNTQADVLLRALSAYKRELQAELNAESVKAENALREHGFARCAQFCATADVLADDILTLDALGYVIGCALDAR